LLLLYIGATLIIGGYYIMQKELTSEDPSLLRRISWSLFGAYLMFVGVFLAILAIFEL